MSADPLKDDLGLELERLVAIEPSPELAARVRTRVARERVAARWWPAAWQLAGAGALSVALTVLLLARGEGVTPPLPVVPPSNTPAISVPVLPLDVALGFTLRPGATRPVRHEPAGRNYPELLMPPLEPPTQISIEPVAIEPLSAIAPLLGERQ